MKANYQMAEETAEQVLTLLYQQVEAIEDFIARQAGMNVYRNNDGFSQEQLYDIAGRNDCVFTILIRPYSLSYEQFGSHLTGVFEYTLRERKQMESKIDSFNCVDRIKIRNLLYEYDNDKADKLLKEGLSVKDIVAIFVLPSTTECNTFPSSELRTPNVNTLFIEPGKNGEDIGWMYGFLRRLKDEKIGLTPEEEYQYLAYKLIIDPDDISDEERRIIFNSMGKVHNRDVAYHYLLWKREAHVLTESEDKVLENIKELQRIDRFIASDQALNNMGLSMNKLAKSYPEKALLIFRYIETFYDKRFNPVGSFPLYMNFETFLHVYLRHVEELRVENQFAERDKFQLAEKDVFSVMDIVMTKLNDEYQEYKKTNPNGRFYRKGKMAFYYNGDYYCVDVNPNGSINTFYKCS